MISLVKYFIEVNSVFRKLVRIEFDPLLPAFFALLAPSPLYLIRIVLPFRLRRLHGLKHGKVHQARVVFFDRDLLFFFNVNSILFFLLH